MVVLLYGQKSFWLITLQIFLDLWLCQRILWIQLCPAVSPSVYPSICNTVFSGFAQNFFVVFPMKLGFNKRIKVAGGIFLEKLIMLEMGQWVTFRAEINIMNLSQNQLFRFFWICTLWQTLDCGEKWRFWIFKGKS